MTRPAWVLALLLLVPTPTPAQSRSGGLAFYWAVLPGGRQAELYASGYLVGFWDADSERYYRINVDGTRTGPVTPPWGMRKHTKPTEATPEPEPQPEPVVVKEPAPPREWYEELPSWTGYAVGGCITLLISCIGLAIQFRKT